MYFKYIWNNFLHIQVEICTAMILAMPPARTDMQPDTEQETTRESILIKHVRLEYQRTEDLPQTAVPELLKLFTTVN